MASSTTGTGPPELLRARLRRLRLRDRQSRRKREHPSAICQLGPHECEILALEDAISEGIVTEDHDNGSAGAGNSAGYIIVDSQPYVVLLRRGQTDSIEKTPTPRQDHAASLTRREIEIASLVAEGKKNKQIAYQLKISEWTVSTHLRRIFVKLGVNSRANMVALLMSGKR